MEKKVEELERDNSIKKLGLKTKDLELKQKDDKLQESRKTLKRLNDELGLLPIEVMDNM